MRCKWWHTFFCFLGCSQPPVIPWPSRTDREVQVRGAVILISQEEWILSVAQNTPLVPQHPYLQAFSAFPRFCAPLQGVPKLMSNCQGQVEN